MAGSLPQMGFGPRVAPGIITVGGETYIISVYTAEQKTGAEIARLGSLFSSDPLLKEMFPGDANDYLLNLESELEGRWVHQYPPILYV